jgi:hypothetical protein
VNKEISTMGSIVKRLESEKIKRQYGVRKR